jgi:hypothetical protein
MDRDDEDQPGLDASEPAITSTSHTLVVSEDPKTPLETTDLPPSPRALRKKPRIGAAGQGTIAAGSLPNPLLDDVSLSCLFFSIFVKKSSF